MEKLQGPIHPCFLGCQVLEEQLNIGCLEEENVDLGLNYGLQYVNNPESLRFDEYTNISGVPAPSVNASHTLPNLDDKMPFLQMLRSFDYPPAFQEPNFQFLLRLQQQQQQEKLPSYLTVNTELESCVTNEIVELDLHSPVKSEIREQTPQQHQVQQQEEEVQVPIDKTCTGSKSKRCLLDSTKVEGRGRRQNQMHNNKAPAVAVKERRKRKRTRPAKNKEEVETQRMAHIAVERNRRRQMNEHLSTLRAMMPSSYVQRGDQASIIGGAIDFVKELEQLLQSLQAQKRMKKQPEETGGDASASSSSTTTTTSCSNMLSSLLMASPVQFSNTNHKSHLEDGNSGGGTAEEEVVAAAGGGGGGGGCGDEFMAEKRSEIADIGAVVIHNHVNLKVHCKRRRHGQLLKAIVAFEDLRLSVLHLNITSLHGLADYSFNLKIEDDCNLRSADEIVGAVHRVFSLINSS